MDTKDIEKFEIIKDVHSSYDELPIEKQEYIRGLMQGILISCQNAQVRQANRKSIA